VSRAIVLENLYHQRWGGDALGQATGAEEDDRFHEAIFVLGVEHDLLEEVACGPMAPSRLYFRWWKKFPRDAFSSKLVCQLFDPTVSFRQLFRNPRHRTA